jgi:hypothetical protein
MYGNDILLLKNGLKHFYTPMISPREKPAASNYAEGTIMQNKGLTVSVRCVATSTRGARFEVNKFAIL